MALIPNAGTVRIGQDVEVVSTKDQPSRTYRLDFDTGRVGGFVDELEAMRQAILKILQTERFSHLIYSWNYGIELNAILGKSFPVFSSEIRRVLREALLEDRRITGISDIVVSQTGRRTASVSFTAATVFGEVPIETEVKVSV